MFSYSTLELIQRAEEDIAAGKHLLALGLLAEAARREPGNRTIDALVLQADRELGSAGVGEVESEHCESPSELRARRVSQAFGGEFGEGIGLLPDGSDDSRLEGRVRLLTTVATNLYERGASEEAVQCLIKAHLLDPKSPHVDVCERLLRPALERIWRQQENPPAPRRQLAEEGDLDREMLTTYLQKNALTVSHDATSRTAIDLRPFQAVWETRRLEALRARQDLERRKREIFQWRQASQPPGRRIRYRVQKVGSPIPPDEQEGSAQGKPTPQLSAFFAKLKQGRLFG